MPYGSQTATETYFTSCDIRPKGGTPSTVKRTYPNQRKNGFVEFSRSGTNASSKPISSYEKRRDGPFTLVSVREYSGPKLSYKVKNRHGKYVYARSPVWVWKYKRLPSKVDGAKKKRVGMNLTPNALNFRSTQFVCDPDVSIVSVDPQGGTVISRGALWLGIDPWTLKQALPASDYMWADFTSDTATNEATADKLAITAFYDAVKNQDVNLLQALAERRQTIDLLISIVKSVSLGLRHLKRGNVSAAIKQLLPNNPKGVADAHLAYQYGVKPLLKDIDGVAEVLAKPEDISFDIKKSKTSMTTRVSENTQAPCGTMAYRTRVTIESKVTVVYKTRVKISSISREIGRLGFGNLGSVAWEILPWSFVIDWFLPIGNYLNNSDAFAGLTCLWTTKTVFKKETVHVERIFGGKGLYGDYTIPGTTQSFTVKRVSCNRKLLAAPPVLPVPSFKDPISKSHIANAIALLVQLKRK